MDPLTRTHLAALADSAAAVAESAARDSYGRMLALIASSTRDIGAAEDALADAFERALRTWPVQGVPDRPAAWLLTVARNRLRDEWKSAWAQRTVALDINRHAPQQFDELDELDVDGLPDDRLALMLACSHPALNPSMHTPLMLNAVLGCTAEQIGRAFSIPTSTMATRLVRAKQRIKAAGIPFRIPERADLPPRFSKRYTAPTSSTGRRPGRRLATCPRRPCSWPNWSATWPPRTPRRTAWPRWWNCPWRAPRPGSTATPGTSRWPNRTYRCGIQA
jgi:DNA-directed RNA polymerase specialized sigma24 family protein